MSTPTTISPARALLDLLDAPSGRPTPTDDMADKAMADFLADIAMLDGRHNRSKRLTQDQLAEQVFRRSPTFKDDRALVPYLRYQLRVALEELKCVDQEMRKQNNGTITFAVLTRYTRSIRDYLFDLREILVFLQRNVPGWTFFDGRKNSDVSSWEVYILARGLGSGPIISG